MVKLQVVSEQKKEPSVLVTQKRSIKKYPSKVYHIIKPKGKSVMIELIIKAESAQEISVEVQELANQLTGTHKCECKHETVEQPKDEPAKAEPKKATKKAEKSVEEPATVIEEVKEETPAPEEAPKAEEPAKAVEEKTYTVDEVRAAAKDFAQKDPANKNKIAEFLHNELGVKSITEAPADVYPRIIEFVGAN